jgi:3-hydroxyisobutyrate dehydrogenase
MKLGLIGTGLMGTPLAKKIIDAGNKLNVYNRTISKTSEIESYGAKVYKDPSMLIKDSDEIILMLTDFDAIHNILFDEYDGQFQDKTIIQMSTIAPEESKELQRRIQKLRGQYFEAPVLGSIKQIMNLELIVLVGGSKEQFKMWQPLFSVFSKKILHIGEVGDASAMKLALNQLIISQTVAFSMSLGYLRENNLDTNQFMEILRGSALYAPTFDKKLYNMINREFQNPNFPLKHLLKDLDLILGEFAESGINTNSLKGTRKILVDSIQHGYADHDYSALYNSIHTQK